MKKLNVKLPQGGSKRALHSGMYASALAVVGLYLLSCMGVSQINKGDLYLMGCALAFSVQITCIDRLAGNLDGLRMNCIQALVVTVLSVPFILLTKETVVFSDITACWFPLVFSGVLSMGVAYTLQIVGQPRPVVRGDCGFSFGSSLFVLAVLRGYVLPPPLGEKAGPDFCCGCEASFCRTVAVRTAVVLQGILSECFSAFLSRRCFEAAVRCVVRCRQASPTPRRSAARRSS